MNEPVVASVPEHVVDKWVADLRRIVVGGQVTVIAEVGEYLIANVYRGEEEALSRRRGKAASIPKLAARAEEFGMTASGLLRAVPIALQVRALGKTLSGKLSVRQHRALLPVKGSAEKKELAEEAVLSRLTATDLQHKVRREHKPHPGGRSKEPPARRVTRRMAALTDGISARDVREGMDRIAPSEARHLLGQLKNVRARIEQMMEALERARG